MTTNMTTAELTDFLATVCEGIDRPSLRIHAEVILEHVPELPSILQTINAEPLDNPGRVAAFASLTGNIKGTMYDTYPKFTLRTPTKIREHAETHWSEKNELQDMDLPVADLVRRWALTNAAYETAPASESLFDPKSTFRDLIYILDAESFATRYHYRHIRREVNISKDVLTKRYWRGIAAYDRIGWWIDDTDHGYEFIKWLGEQDDINKVIRVSSQLRSTDIDEIKEGLNNPNLVLEPLHSAMEVEDVLKKNALVANLGKAMNIYRSDSDLWWNLSKFSLETLTLLSSYSETGLMNKSTGDFLEEVDSEERIKEAVFFSTRFNIEASVYDRQFAPMFRSYQQFPAAQDYSADEKMIPIYDAFIRVTQALLTAEEKYDWDEKFSESVFTSYSYDVKTIRDTRFVQMLFNEYAKAPLIAEIITERNIVHYKKITDVLNEMESAAPAILEGAL